MIITMPPEKRFVDNIKHGLLVTNRFIDNVHNGHMPDGKRVDISKNTFVNKTKYVCNYLNIIDRSELKGRIYS